VRTIIQVSDLHFGSILEPTLDPLITLMWALQPDLVIVSGDFTQRAKPEQFRAAQRYLARMPSPRIVVPGNHDIPLYNVYRRFVKPLEAYNTHISRDMAPSFADDEVAVVGINSARSFTFKGGSLGREQVAVAVSALQRAAPGAARIVVSHHPFHIPLGLSGVAVVDGIDHAMHAFAECGVDLFLAGHLHLVHQASAEVYVPGFRATILQAGTATSTRARGEPNSFFVLRVSSDTIEVDVRQWNAAHGEFVVAETRILPRGTSANNAGVPPRSIVISRPLP